MKSVASPMNRRAARLAAAVLAAVLLPTALLSGCANVLDKPVRPVLYDFGPGQATPATPVASTTASPLAPLLLGEVEANGVLDTSAMLYRLAYANAQELRPYALARWSAPPAVLVQQRLRQQLGLRRIVLDAGEAVSLTRPAATGAAAPRPADNPPTLPPLSLRLELEEFSHVFTAPAQSSGLVRLRVTALERGPAGDRLLAQRTVVAQRPAASADASGGAAALAAATDAAALEIEQWLAQIR